MAMSTASNTASALVESRSLLDDLVSPVAGATAKLIDAVPLISHAPPARRTVKRKAAARNTKASKRKAA